MFSFGTRARHMSRKLSALVNGDEGDDDGDGDDGDDDDDEDGDEDTRRAPGMPLAHPQRRHVSISAFISVDYSWSSD